MGGDRAIFGGAFIVVPCIVVPFIVVPSTVVPSTVVPSTVVPIAFTFAFSTFSPLPPSPGVNEGDHLTILANDVDQIRHLPLLPLPDEPNGHLDRGQRGVQAV